MKLWSLRHSPARGWHWRLEWEVSAETASDRKCPAALSNP